MSRHIGIRESTLHRIIMMGTSLLLIVQTMSVDDELGWRVIFPLIAIYPGLAALLGFKLRPSREMFEAGKNKPEVGYRRMAAQS
jgi:hypothetical protein